MDILPILPVNSPPLPALLDIPFASVKSAKVVSVEWNGHKLAPTNYSVSFYRYWKAVSSSMYNRDRIMILDLSGINRRSPQFKLLNHLVKNKKVWMDNGVTTAPEAMDAIVENVESAVIGSKSIVSLGEYEEIFDMTELCTPCVDWADGLVTSAVRMDDVDFNKFRQKMLDIGFKRILLMDYKRLGKGSGFDARAVKELVYDGFDVYVGGGITEAHIPTLKDIGAKGALIDPFTPIIRGIVNKIQDPDLAIATAPASVKSASKAPSGHIAPS